MDGKFLLRTTAFAIAVTVVTLTAIAGYAGSAYAESTVDKTAAKDNKKPKEKEKKPKKHAEQDPVSIAPGAVTTETVTTVGDDYFTPICPETTSETIIDVFNTYVDDPLTFGIYFPVPHEESVQYSVTAVDQAVLEVATLEAPDDYTNSILIDVAAGAHESERYWVLGHAVTETSLRFQRTGIDPDTGLPYPSWTVPVNVWQFDEVVDYTDLGGSLPCYDPNDPPALVSGFNKTVCGFEPDAVAADGTSRLLLRLKTGMAGQACFKVVEDGVNDMGQMDPTDSSLVSTATDVASPYWAFGTYLSPNAFGEQPDAEREVEVEVAFTPAVSTGTLSNTIALRKKIKIRRPPTLLVHGVWSDSGTWSEDFAEPNSAAYRLIQAMNYKKTNSASFDTNIPKVGEEIAKLREKSRNKLTAVTRVDVVAHSMGGMLTRGWIAHPDYRRADNLNAGDVHRLITLSTPHYGSQLANLLINAFNEYAPDEVVLEYVSDEDYGYIPTYFHPIEKLTTNGEKWMTAKMKEGAVCDLAENSVAIASPGADDVEARGYTASGGPTGELLFPLSELHEGFGPTMYQQHIDPYVYTVANDAIVAQDSQQGGLPGDDDPTLIHYYNPLSAVGLEKLGITRSATVAAKVFADLDSSDLGRFVPLPDVTSTTLGAPRIAGRGIDIDEAAYAAQCYDGGPMNP